MFLTKHLKIMNKLLSIVFLLNTSFFYSQVLPSTGFENWSDNGLNFPGYEDPTGWLTSNINEVSVANPTTKTTDSHSGQYAVVLKTVYTPFDSISAGMTIQQLLLGGLPTDTLEYLTGDGMLVSSKPTKLVGWFKYLSQNGSEGTLTTYMSKWNNTTMTRDTVCYQVFTINHLNDYSLKEFVFDYSGVNGVLIPDSIRLAFDPLSTSNIGAFANYNNCQLYIDDLELIYDESTNGITENKTDLFRVYPNPIDSEFNLEISQQIEKDSHLRIVNSANVLVYEQYHLSNKNTINLSNLTSGVYFIILTNKDVVYNYKLIKL